ncbi:MAG: NADH-ubiquinone oxidoreductase chain J, partial [uncultured Acidimicrobiales bacterium]
GRHDRVRARRPRDPVGGPRRDPGPQPRALRPHVDHDAVRGGGGVRRPGGALPGRRAGDRLRRRHRRALPVRDHAARGRPGGQHRDGADRRPAAGGRRRGAGERGAARAAGGPGGAGEQRGQVDVQRPRRGGHEPREARPRPVHRLPLRLRGHLGAARHRGGGRRRAGPQAGRGGRAGPQGRGGPRPHPLGIGAL